jgi:DNA-binding NarL/FixJ family response regulator
MQHRILIVDDHGVVRRGLKQILEAELGSVECCEAVDGVDALVQIRNSSWDVVVLDITLPQRSGLDVLKEIRGFKPDLPVLVLSMHPEDQYGVRVLRAGASGYLTKESAPEELGDAVRKVLAGGHYVSPALAEKLAGDVGRVKHQAPHELLSDREYQVMCLIASGKTVSEIAEMLSLSVKTISTYRSRILDKMDVKDNAKLTYYALDQGLVPRAQTPRDA